ncbi:alpha/beta hydrolase [Litchfieldia salsa]|uniref:Esterase/lipase n=1 Tax=Litchfieldia salsa TaxID=930152 RepID=A0A1H0WX99_9BACI|nr:alpha/beta fold hydrolase [Litchfieldia salsa]SDP95394.1 Esterase/lipase [Litchfieldia salsa]
MIGCLCIHGFTGSPYEVEPLTEYLRKKTDWMIVSPTLPGHGETLSLKGLTYNDWVESAEEELKKLFERCDEVYVIGFSMGGIIAGHLASIYPIKKLILLSAAVYYVNPKQLLVDVRSMLVDAVKGSIQENELYQRYKKKIEQTPITATMEFRRLVRQVRPKIKEIQIPTLIVQGECDGIVPIKSAYYLYQKIASDEKRLCLLPHSKHHVCHGEDQEKLFSEVEIFLHN